MPTIPGLLAYSKSVREAAVAAGRDPSTIKLFAGICPIVARTEEEAWEKHDRYKANTSVVGGLSSFCALTGVDLSKYGLDEPFNFDDEDLQGAGIQGRSSRVLGSHMIAHNPLRYFQELQTRRERQGVDPENGRRKSRLRRFWTNASRNAVTGRRRDGEMVHRD